MVVDIFELDRFYAKPLGGYVQNLLANRIQHIWPHPAKADDVVVGYGYAAPLVTLWPMADWHLLCPAQQGVLAAKPDSPSTILIDESHWPIRDNSVNRLVALHGLESAAHLEGVLDEAWRVLRPNARAMFIIPNRRGSWAASDKTPFGAGRSFLRRQFARSLRRTGFVPHHMRAVLMLPPFLPLRVLTALGRVEQSAAFIAPYFGGVWVIDAVKQIPAPLSVRRARLARARPMVGVIAQPE